MGTAGHFKDPAPGQDISDAIPHAEGLGEAIVASWDGPLDAALRRWERWRDADAYEMHWLATDMGRAGTVPLVLVEIVRGMLATPDGGRRMFDVFNHRQPPSAILTPLELARATVRLLRDGRHRRADVLSEVGGVLRQEVRRRWLNVRHAYVPG